ncbi:MAG: tetratricopeptide repeat protein [Saprospiraceae bacterium]|nr:tetratricopeptide repeat protein [Saprospiraceae bacterium]
MKKLIIGLLALMLTVTSLVSYSQTKDEAGQALNAGIALKDMDVNAAIEKFNDCIKICEQVGTEADDLKAQAEKVLPGLYYESARAFYKAKKLPEAINGFEKASQMSAKYNNEALKAKSDEIIPQLYAIIGTNFYKENDYDNAIINYDKAIILDSNSLKAHFGKALTYDKKGESDKFKEEIDKVIEIGPVNHKTVIKAKEKAIKYYQNQAINNINSKNYDEGLTDLNTSLIYGEDDNTYFYFAVAYNAQQKWDEATEAANKALELATDDKMKAQINAEIEKTKKGMEAK